MSKYLTAAECMIAGLEKEDSEYINSNFYVKTVPKRGRSVFTNRAFKKGEYVMEYKGLCKKYNESEYLLSQKMYEINGELSYCLEFTFQNQKYTIDGTREYEYGISRLINHARNPNLKLFRPIMLKTEGNPRISMFAATNIAAGDELFWDYFLSLNPAKCILDNTIQTVPPEMNWMYCRRKAGKIIYPSKEMSANRSGLCTLCYEFKKRLSNHLNQVHDVKSPAERRKLISEGREYSSSVSKLSELKKGKQSRCPICHRDLKQLSTHLSRIHRVGSAKKKEIFKRFKESEIEKRRVKLQDS